MIMENLEYEVNSLSQFHKKEVAIDVTLVLLSIYFVK